MFPTCIAEAGSKVSICRIWTVIFRRVYEIQITDNKLNLLIWVILPDLYVVRWGLPSPRCSWLLLGNADGLTTKTSFLPSMIIESTSIQFSFKDEAIRVCSGLTSVQLQYWWTCDRTGATGYIGGDALYAIVKAHPEYEVTALVRNTDKGAQVATQYPKAKLVYGDLNSSSLLEEESRKADVVCRTSTLMHRIHTSQVDWHIG